MGEIEKAAEAEAEIQLDATMPNTKESTRRCLRYMFDETSGKRQHRERDENGDQSQLRKKEDYTESDRLPVPADRPSG